MRNLVLVMVLALPVAAFARKGDPPPASWYVSDANKEAISDANSLLAQKKFAEAMSAYDVVLAAEPACGVCLLGAGKARLGAGQASDAVAPLEKATTLFGDKADAWIPYSQALLGTQQYPKAVDAAKKAMVLKPTNVDALWVAQQALVAQKDYAGAHTMLTDARGRGWMVVHDCMDGFVFVAEGNMASAGEMQAKCRDFHPWSDQLAEVVTAAGGVPAAPVTPAANVVATPAPAP